MAAWRELAVFLPALVLHFVRAGAFFVAMPLFGQQSDSRMLRLVLAVALATIFWWLGPKSLPLRGGMLELGVLAAREAAIGLLAGFAVGLLTAALSTAGELISNEMGFSMAQIVNPETGKTSAVVSELFEVTGFLLIFALDLHHEVLRVLGACYEALPVGREFDIAPIWDKLRASIGDTLEWALRYAMPVLAVMLLTTAALVMLSRAVPNINLMEFSYGARILLAVLTAAYFLGEGMPFLVEVFETLLGRAKVLFHA